MKKYDKTMMKNALIWSEESYCIRKKVGAVIAFEGRIKSTGYNGTISGFPNPCEKIVGTQELSGELELTPDLVSLTDLELFDVFAYKNNLCNSCKLLEGTTSTVKYDINTLFSFKYIAPVYETLPTVQHAERNAMDFAGKHGISLEGATMYVTLEPCVECAKSIITTGIKRVVFLEEYRIKDGVPFLREAGIEVIQLKDLD